jgi:hypothetical protein
MNQGVGGRVLMKKPEAKFLVSVSLSSLLVYEQWSDVSLASVILVTFYKAND